MKIVVSGWGGTGTTTLSLILAYQLKLKYIHGSRVFRLLGSKMKLKDTGKDRYKADEILEKEFGKIYDEYIDFLLLSEKYQNIVIDSQIAAFRVGKQDNFFSIFLAPDMKVRRERYLVDGRKEDADVLEERDERNRKFYYDLHKVDWFDLEEIKDKHSFVLDNSTISIAEEIKIIRRELIEKYPKEQAKISTELQDPESYDKNFWENGKPWYIKKLKEENLLMTAEEILIDINLHFGDKIQNLPSEIRNLIASE